MKKTILIIEDEAPMREVLREKLTREGFATLEAKNGKEGVEIALREHPDLILLDIIMPVMDGITTLKKLRSNDGGKDIPVIVLTNLSDAGDTATAFEKGACDYLIKCDWKLEDIVAKIRERLDN